MHGCRARNSHCRRSDKIRSGHRNELQKRAAHPHPESSAIPRAVASLVWLGIVKLASDLRPTLTLCHRSELRQTGGDESLVTWGLKFSVILQPGSQGSQQQAAALKLAQAPNTPPQKNVKLLALLIAHPAFTRCESIPTVNHPLEISCRESFDCQQENADWISWPLLLMQPCKHLL